MVDTWEMHDKVAVYVSVDETALVNRLFNVKDAFAIYYAKGKKIAYQWILHPITFSKLSLPGK